MTNARTAKSAREKSAEMRAQAARQETRKRNTLVLAAVLAVLAVAVGATVLVRTATHDQAVAQAAAEAPPANVNADGGIVVGDGGAKVTITTYEDFQCPACASFEEANATQIEKWIADGTVKVEYRPIAFLDEQSTTGYSTRALVAAAAVVDKTPSAFPAFHKLLFANQPAEGSAGLDDAKLVELAGQAGGDTAAVQTALSQGKFKGWTAKVTDAFFTAKYTGTPTILVNGTQLKDWSPTALAAAVQKAAA